ncbi:MAG: transcriptional regulator [Candidatus Melainabacteria bacterium GWF2_37_15]|nr:MAG: transcriptional regulator [Candidatus Melainabacteria bacterium GWF2_37_15]
MLKNNLAVLMARKKIRIAELHRITGISASSLSNLYNEKTDMISFRTIEKLCEALDCTVGELFEYIPE